MTVESLAPESGRKIDRNTLIITPVSNNSFIPGTGLPDIESVTAKLTSKRLDKFSLSMFPTKARIPKKGVYKMVWPRSDLPRS